MLTSLTLGILLEYEDFISCVFYEKEGKLEKASLDIFSNDNGSLDAIHISTIGIRHHTKASRRSLKWIPRIISQAICLA